jgi:hypothetical protein
MTSKLKLLPLAIIAGLGMMLAACGGGGSSDNATAAPTKAPAANANGSNDELFVRNGVEVLGRSATQFQSADVTSFTGETSFTFKLGSMSFSETSNFASQDPDQFYMEMSLGGGNLLDLVPLGEGGVMKVLARDGVFYMNLFGGWMSFTPDDLGTSQEEMQSMMNTGSLFDYAKFVQDHNNVTYVNDETVNGHETARYKFEGTVQELFSSFSDALGGGASAFEDQLASDAANMPITIDLWIGKDDFLPYKMAMSASANTAEGPMELSGDATFDNYNKPAPIPDAPKDAVSISDFFKEVHPVDTDTPAR